MPIWPFRRSRRKAAADAQAEPFAEKSRNIHSESAATAGTTERPSRTESAKRKRNGDDQSDEKAERLKEKEALPRASAPGKENIEGGYRRQESMDEITALPVKWKLEHSPHLRPVDSEKAAIPYNFRNSGSQTSITPGEGPVSRAGTLRSKRSIVSSTPKRQKSSKRKADAKLREEEIRAMSATMPRVPQTTLASSKRNSYKRRTLDNGREQGLPTAEELSSGQIPPELNGWQVQHFWSSPRPPVRLSHIPTYAHDIADAQVPLSEEVMSRSRPKTRDTPRRHKYVGDEADELDSSEIRAALERDAKERKVREREKQLKLDRKLRELEKPGQSRRATGKRRQDADVDLKALEAGLPLAMLQRPGMDRNASSIHPAFRDEPALADDPFDLSPEEVAQNPFESPVITPLSVDRELGSPADLATPFDDPVVETAREIRMSTAFTPPLSPVEGRRRSSVRALEPLSAPSTAVPTSSSSIKHTASVSKDRRAGAWASFFKRGDSVRETTQPETTFANTSRESVSKQMAPLSAITTRESAFTHSSDLPQRMNSKFREELADDGDPAMDSAMRSLASPTNVVTAAAAQEEDAQAGAQSGRSDTPVSPVKPHSAVPASLASVDSEGSWLASGGSIKRASQQSGVSRGYGSLTRRTPDFKPSFEELGAAGDKDAEYIQRDAEAQRHARAQINEAALLEEEDAMPGAESNEPIVHDSIQRHPTLVHRSLAARSREGLLAEASNMDDSAIKDDSGEDEALDAVVVQPVTHTIRHARQVSAGSAKVLDIAPRRSSSIIGSPISPTVSPTSVRTAVSPSSPNTAPVEPVPAKED